VTQQIVEE
jgi:hypothetical protein